ncbi:hypothetical protein GUJ93_ZPchr0203g2857 [Zizania palustris]|uniref:Uncharacterized protein n=1 Tax=Zizania palustris TaxID=103762 RepID=A0A8J5QUN2_ZIZPA|nr:hypothetical protein GUJ93_ZPchr0203g2857 [Zizania palustris]
MEHVMTLKMVNLEKMGKFISCFSQPRLYVFNVGQLEILAVAAPTEALQLVHGIARTSGCKHGKRQSLPHSLVKLQLL